MGDKLIARPDVDIVPLENGGAVLFDEKSGKFLLLNASAAVVWADLAEGRTETELAHTIQDRFPTVSITAAEEDALEVVERFRSLELLAADGQATPA